MTPASDDRSIIMPIRTNAYITLDLIFFILALFVRAEKPPDSELVTKQPRATPKPQGFVGRRYRLNLFQSLQGGSQGGVKVRGVLIPISIDVPNSARIAVEFIHGAELAPCCRAIRKHLIA